MALTVEVWDSPQFLEIYFQEIFGVFFLNCELIHLHSKTIKKYINIGNVDLDLNSGLDAMGLDLSECM